MIERRYNDGRVELRKADGKATIVGHAAVFDKLSENLGGFREKINRGAFDSVLKDDVRALIDHNPSLVLARTTAGNLEIRTDKSGLLYEAAPTETTYARDLLLNLEAGNITQSSFGFQVDDADWDEDDEGRIVRTIKKFRHLYDVSPVTFPAYPDTDVSKRALEGFLAARKARDMGKIDRMHKESEVLEYLARMRP